jgi:hypothetical protein
MGLSQSNHRLLGGAKSSLSTTFTPCLIGGARRPLTKEQRKRKQREYDKKRRRNMTAEQRKQRYRYTRDYNRKMTKEQREKKNRKARERRARMTKEQREEKNRMQRERRLLDLDEMDRDLDNVLNKILALDEMDLPDIGDLDELLAREVAQEVDQEVALAELDDFRIMELNELLDIL